MCDKNKNKLLLYIYGELSEKESENITKHLSDCESCRTELKKMKLDMKMIGSLKVRELQFDKEKVKNNILKRLGQKQRLPFYSHFVIKTAAVLSIFIVGIFVGKIIFSPEQGITTLKKPGSTDHNKLLIKDHFEMAGDAILEFTNNKFEVSLDKTKDVEKKKILSLLQDTRFLKFRFTGTRDEKLLEFLDELEVVLTELSNISPDDREYLSIMKEMLLEKDIVHKLRSYREETISL